MSSFLEQKRDSLMQWQKLTQSIHTILAKSDNGENGEITVATAVTAPVKENSGTEGHRPAVKPLKAGWLK